VPVHDPTLSYFLAPFGDVFNGVLIGVVSVYENKIERFIWDCFYCIVTPALYQCCVLSFVNPFGFLLGFFFFIKFGLEFLEVVVAGSAAGDDGVSVDVAVDVDVDVAIDIAVLVYVCV
jgi:hypothetical protein